MGTAELTIDLSRRAGAVSSSRIRDLLRLVDRPDVLSLAGGLPAPESLDVDRIGIALAAALERRGPLGPIALQYGPTEGVDELRAVVGRRLEVPAHLVLITTGSQQGLDLVARALCDPGDEIVVETPSYLGALQAFVAAGARLRAIPGDEQGFDVDHLAVDLAAGHRPKLVYVVPNFHNPTGSVIPVDRRMQLAALADRYGFVVLEDDPYRELSFSGSVPPPIATFTDRVVRLGSASKVLAPGLRVGWLTGPRPLVEAAARLKQAVDLHTPTLNQLAVAALLGDTAGQAAHLDRVRGLYASRAAALATALDRLGARVHVSVPTGGMFTWVTTTDGTDTDELLTRALRHGVAFVPGSAFGDGAGHESLHHSMRLSFATLEPHAFDVAISRLVAAWS